MLFRDLYDILETAAYVVFGSKAATITNREAKAIYRRTDGAYRLATPELDRELTTLLADLSMRAGLDRPPKLIIYDSKRPNATCLDTGSIIVSTGFVERMNTEAQQFALAHEITHLSQRTSIFASYFFSALLPVVGATAATIRTAKHDGTEPYSPLKALKYVGIFSVAYHLIKELVEIPMCALMRKQELEADKGGLLLTGNLEGAKSEFAAYQQYVDEELKPRPILPTSPLPLDYKIKGELLVDPPPPSFAERLRGNLYRTHPSNEARLRYLEKVKKEECISLL